MSQTYEAVLQPDGHLHFVEEPAGLSRVPHRVLVTFTDAPLLLDTALCGAALSEPALAEDWLRDEEDAAWAHLQPAK